MLCQSSSRTSLRPRFLSEIRRLFSILRRLDALVGRVDFRYLGSCATLRINSLNLFNASATFLPWSRNRWLWMINSPVLEIRREYLDFKRWATASGRLVVLSIGHRKTTLVLTLFTFCPPGPGDLAYEKLNSFKGIEIESLTINMGINLKTVESGLNTGITEYARHAGHPAEKKFIHTPIQRNDFRYPTGQGTIQTPT